MNANLQATVIVVGYNGKRYLRDCLSSILDQDLPADQYEVIFVDNDSSDRSAEWVRRRFPTVQVIAFNRNLGFFAACNKVASIAQGRYLVVVPQDTIAHRRWLPELVRAAQENDEALIFTANSIGPDATDYAAQERVGPVNEIHYRELSRLGHVTFRTAPYSSQAFWTLACSGVSGLFKPEILAKTGCLFEPLLGHYASDMEAGLRASVAGYKVLCVPTAVIYHVGDEAKSLSDMGLMVRYALGSRDILLAYYKNMTPIEFLLALPLLTLGRAAKCLELRTSLSKRIVLLLASLVATPALLLLTLARLPRFTLARQTMADRRAVDRLWLLRQILIQQRGPGECI
jgi:GT2 family glycosyltransferase